MLDPRIIPHSLVALIFICGTFFSSNSHAQFGEGPSAFFGFSPSVITPGQSTTLGWSANNPSASSCRILGVPELANQTLGTNGTITLTPTNNITATLICGFSISNIVEATLIVNRPTLSVSFSPSTVQTNQPSTFRWSSNGFSSCTDIAGPLSISGTSGTRVLSSQTVNEISVTVRCTEANGASITRTAILSVVPPPPQMSISVPPVIFGPGLADIAWSSGNTTGCFSSLLGSLPTSGVRLIFVDRDTFVSITCFGPGGSVTRSAFIDLLNSPFGNSPADQKTDLLTSTDGDLKQLNPLAARVGEQLRRADINDDGFEDLIIVNSQTQIGYILLNNNGELDTIGKVIEGISDIRQISSIFVDNLENIHVEMTVTR